MTNYKPYTGIGSRETPQEVCDIMTAVAHKLSQKGFTLRSGRAPGADQAFERGCPGKHEIFLPWKGFCHDDGDWQEGIIPDKSLVDAMQIASQFHKGWDYLKPAVRKLMARNINQILGENLDYPTLFVVCWTPDGCVSDAERTKNTGGTGQAISVADYYDIPIFNLKREDHMCRILKFLEG